MRISDWSSDVCSSDLRRDCALWFGRWFLDSVPWPRGRRHGGSSRIPDRHVTAQRLFRQGQAIDCHWNMVSEFGHRPCPRFLHRRLDHRGFQLALRSEEHTSELQSLMRISYAVFCLKKKKNTKTKMIM